MSHRETPDERAGYADILGIPLEYFQNLKII